MPVAPFLIRQAYSLSKSNDFRDCLTDNDPLASSLAVNEVGLVISHDTGHTAQQQETTDDR
jgi:hypothetical protein